MPTGMARRQTAWCRALVVVAVTTSLAKPVLGFYLPGVAPQDYAKARTRVTAGASTCVALPQERPCVSVGGEAPLHCVTPNAAVLHPARTQGDAVGVKVQKLSSTKTQLPYEYYSLPFCKPAEIVNSVENLGEVCALLTTSGGRRRMLRLGYSVDTRKLDTRARRLLAFLQVLRGDRIENSVFVVRSPLPSAPTHDSAVG